MKNIFKILSIFSFLSLIMLSCKDEAEDWKSEVPSFKLNDISNTILFPTNEKETSMVNNPFTLVWDNTLMSSENYNVVFSKNPDFSNKVSLGTSTKTSFTTTIGNLNSALLSAGYNPHSNQLVYVRIETGEKFSNTVSFVASPYPISAPFITAPTNGSSITLNSADQSATATTITWSDKTYGVEVKYNVEMALKGSSNFKSLGIVTVSANSSTGKSLAITNKDLNTGALNAGGSVNVEGEFDFRVTAKSEFSTPAISLTSAIVTAKMKPYQVDYPDFYLVGGATAIGWDAPKSQKLFKKDNTSVIYTFLQPDEGFRFLGQADWNPVNYSMDDAGIRDSYKYFKTVSSNVVRFSSTNDENMKITGAAGIYKVVINADFGVKSLTVTPTTSVWDIPNLYLAGSIQGWNASSALPFQPKGNGVFESDPLELPVGSEFKFLAQQDWSGKEWGNIHSKGNTGYLGINGDNDNIVISSSTSASNFYTIRVDLKRGTYQLIPF